MLAFHSTAIAYGIMLKWTILYTLTTALLSAVGSAAPLDQRVRLSFPAILSCSCTPLTIYDHFQSTFNTVLLCTGNNLQGDCTTIIVEEKVCGIVDSDLVNRVNSLAPLGGSSCDFFAYVSHLEPFQYHSVLPALGTQKNSCPCTCSLSYYRFFSTGVNR